MRGDFKGWDKDFFAFLNLIRYGTSAGDDVGDSGNVSLVASECSLGQFYNAPIYMCAFFLFLQFLGGSDYTIIFCENSEESNVLALERFSFQCS